MSSSSSEESVNSLEQNTYFNDYINYLKNYILLINNLYYNLDSSKIERYINYMNDEDCYNLSSYIRCNKDLFFGIVLKFFNKTRLNNITYLSENEIFIYRSPTIHIVRTINSTEYIYRAEIKKVSENIYDFTFGAHYNFDNEIDKYFNIMKNKLFIFHEEKSIFILDRRGLTYNKNMLLVSYKYEHYSIYNFSQSQIRKHLKLLNLSLQRIFPEYNIFFRHDYNHDNYKLITDIFKNIINYPVELEYMFDPCIVNKINNYNYQYILYENINIDGYNDGYINTLLVKCILMKDDSLYAMIAIWFEHDKFYPIFDL